MARYRHYGSKQIKMIVMPYGQQLLLGTFDDSLTFSPPDVQNAASMKMFGCV